MCLALSELETQLRNVLRCCRLTACWSWWCADVAAREFDALAESSRVPFPRVPRCLGRNALPGARQWPEDLILPSCPERRLLMLICASSELIRVLESLGSHPSSEAHPLSRRGQAPGSRAQVPCLSRGVGARRAFAAFQFQESVRKPGVGLAVGPGALLAGVCATGRGKQQPGEGGR